MSFNRNIPIDIQNTITSVQAGNGGAGGGGGFIDGKNWLGHRADAGNAQIDELLLSRDGVSMAEMLVCRGAVKEHLRHLQIEQGLEVEEIAGLFRFGI